MVIDIITLLLSAVAAVASCAALITAGAHRYDEGAENAYQRKSDADPAKLMREWLYGGDGT